MIFEINPLRGVGALKFGMPQKGVHAILGNEFRSFKRTPTSTMPCEFFEKLGVFTYYKLPDNLEAIELCSPAEAIFLGRDLLKLSFSEINRILISNDPGIEILSDESTSYRLGIGVYAPDVEGCLEKRAQTIIVFESGYYG